MRVLMMTDMEGIAGMVNFVDYCRPESSRYYEHGRRLTSDQVSAAVEGLAAGGASDILVVDGHGPGCLDLHRMHPDAKVLAGRPMQMSQVYEKPFDAAVIVGQHAKANTDGGHLCHTYSFKREIQTLNGLVIGEIAVFLLTCTYHRIPVVMIAGDKAACEEAKKLVPSIHTVPLVEGLSFGSATGLSEEENKRFNVGAIHLPPEKAGQVLKAETAACLSNTPKIKRMEKFWIDPPYEMVRINRATDTSLMTKAVTRGNDWSELNKQPIIYEPVED